MGQTSTDKFSQRVFIMMPFATEFDDVYDVIKSSVVTVDEAIKVVRLDEVRAAGSITEDLIAEIRRSTLCIADLTDSNPNVMWEVGFAAALGKPVVAISQKSDKLPFDIKDIRTVMYNRASLSKTLREPLTAALKATLERYVARRGGLTAEQQKPRLRTIAVTGSTNASGVIAERVDRLLSPYIGSHYHWYVGSFGDSDEAVLTYLLNSGEDSITVVGYSSYDISERQLRILEQHSHVAFVDTQREQLPPVSGSTSERDIFLASRADLIMLIWNGESNGTGALIEWLSEIRKDHIVGFA